MRRPVDVDAVGVGHADPQPVAGQQVGDQAHGGGLAVGAGDGDHRNAAVVAVGDTSSSMIASPTGAALAERRRQVHAQAGRGVDFDDAAALLFQRLQHAVAHHVDAADVEADHLRRLHRARGHFRMDVVGDVGGGAAGATGWRCCAARRAGPWRGTLSACRALLRQRGQRDVVEPDLGQRGGVAVAAARIAVDLFDQLRAPCARRRRSPAAASRRAAATSLSPTTSRRKSWPGR